MIEELMAALWKFRAVDMHKVVDKRVMQLQPERPFTIRKDLNGSSEPVFGSRHSRISFFSYWFL
ncbi:hypothetical protein [Thiohalobacter sp. COW1]|uniref:hypothetical protein n=1 Tax=Thiohalobacter sp. COW1 TaxID=2795687 RepID=UPI0019156D6C|nr:hypothetical protein [Thiohalobacter sp. COW1]